MNLNKKQITIGGVSVDSRLVREVVEVLRQFDRMPNNPDDGHLFLTVERQLIEKGTLNLVAFVCPRFDSSMLFGPTPEKYMPEEATGADLFKDRVRKIGLLREELFRLGVVTTIDIVLGDNDFETYVLPLLPTLRWNQILVSNRKQRYLRSFRKRAERDFGRLATVWSLSDLGIGVGPETPIEELLLDKEVKFFRWLFSTEGPYKGRLQFDSDQLRTMALNKYRAYGAQGDLLAELGGILLQTESPGLWLERTEMFRCSGAPAVPTIYPWIRREEVLQLKVKM